VSADRRSSLEVVFSAVANLRKVLRTAEHTTTEPHSVPLNHVLRDVDFNGFWSLSCYVLVLFESIFYSFLDAFVQTLVEVVEKGATS